MMLEYFQELASGLEKKLQQPSATVARKKLALEIARLGERLFSKKEKIAWCGVLVPFDLLSAMGVTSCFVEFVGATLASSGGVEPFLAEAEQGGYPTDCCSYHRSVVGAAWKDLMPVPDFLVATSAPCSGGLGVIENLAKQFGKDLFVIHIPHETGPEAVMYLADQLRAMVAFVEQHIGERLDPGRLRTAVEHTNRARALMTEIYHLTRTVPSPARRRDLVNFGIVMPLFLGTTRAVELASAYRDEFARSTKTKTAGVKDEKVRLLWIQNRIQFSNPLEKMLEETYQAAVVVDELNDIQWDPIDPDDPFPGFAKRALSSPLTGDLTRRIENLKRLVRLYQVQGAINPCHWGCRQGTGARGLITEGLRQVGVPVLNLEVDCIDARNFALGQLTTRLQAFMEMIQQTHSRAEG